MGVYVGVNSVARNVKSIYVGINGVARKIKKGYIGINGIAEEAYSEGGSSNSYVLENTGNTVNVGWSYYGYSSYRKCYSLNNFGSDKGSILYYYNYDTDNRAYKGRFRRIDNEMVISNIGTTDFYYEIYYPARTSNYFYEVIWRTSNSVFCHKINSEFTESDFSLTNSYHANMKEFKGTTDVFYGGIMSGYSNMYYWVSYGYKLDNSGTSTVLCSSTKAGDSNNQNKGAYTPYFTQNGAMWTAVPQQSKVSDYQDPDTYDNPSSTGDHFLLIKKVTRTGTKSYASYTPDYIRKYLGSIIEGRFVSFDELEFMTNFSASQYTGTDHLYGYFFDENETFSTALDFGLYPYSCYIYDPITMENGDRLLPIRLQTSDLSSAQKQGLSLWLLDKNMTLHAIGFSDIAQDNPNYTGSFLPVNDKLVVACSDSSVTESNKYISPIYKFAESSAAAPRKDDFTINLAFTNKLRIDGSDYNRLYYTTSSSSSSTTTSSYYLNETKNQYTVYANISYDHLSDEFTYDDHTTIKTIETICQTSDKSYSIYWNYPELMIDYIESTITTNCTSPFILSMPIYLSHSVTTDPESVNITPISNQKKIKFVIGIYDGTRMSWNGSHYSSSTLLNSGNNGSRIYAWPEKNQTVYYGTYLKFGQPEIQWL